MRTFSLFPGGCFEDADYAARRESPVLNSDGVGLAKAGAEAMPSHGVAPAAVTFRGTWPRLPA